MFGFKDRAKVQQITGDTYRNLVKDKSLKVQCIDVRTPQEIQGNKIKGFKNIPLQELKSRLDELDKEQPVILLCATGSRSFMAGRVLAKAGFKSLYNIQRGISSL